ncbi:hypothetical protein [Fluviispira vulneris]|uniref:hypothetical protein n=1 Tax=Fluviispira vulneris TaxID=2763012 RepID=UPI00164461C6|nr:hypothetical protein [Fluviispira vulneris]
MFAQSEYIYTSPKIGFDIFLFKDDKIIEHWGVLTDKLDKDKIGTGIQLSGSIQIKDLNLTKENKELVNDLFQNVLIKNNYSDITKYIDSNFKDHIPLKSKFKSVFRKDIYNQNKFKPIRYKTKVRILGEGNFVLLVSEGTYGCESVTFYDLFRIEKKKISEYWNIIEVSESNS